MNGEPERLTARERAMAELLVLALEERRDRYCEHARKGCPADRTVAMSNLRAALNIGRDAIELVDGHVAYLERMSDRPIRRAPRLR